MSFCHRHVTALLEALLGANSSNYVSFISYDNIEKAMSHSKALYEELDLAALQIRIVIIEPGNWADDINCTLQTISLHDHEPYKALSYVWGGLNITKGIILNGQPFQVTINLESALRHLRRLNRRTMWIDAICINQLDLEERASQVRFMRNIYQHATETIVWLGDETLQSKSAFQFIHRYVSEAREDRDGHLENLEQLMDIINGNPSAYQSIEYFGSDILMRPWWTRAWVLQEAAVSKCLTLQCGDDEIEWPSFQTFATGLSSVIDMSWIQVSSMPMLEDISRITAMRMVVSEGYPLPLSHLMAWNRWRRATDPRDQVFSLIGLSTDSQDSILQPDYSTSNQPTDVFHQLVKHCITMRSLDIICMSRGTDKPGWPSWLPDWDVYSAREETTNNSTEFTSADSLIVGFTDPEAVYFPKGIDRRDTTDRDFLSSDYTASSSMAPKCSTTTQPLTLRAAGTCVDSIRAITRTCQVREAGWSSAEIESWENFILSNFKDSRRVRRNGEAFSVSEVTVLLHDVCKYANELRDTNQTIGVDQMISVDQTTSVDQTIGYEKLPSLWERGQAALKRWSRKTKTPRKTKTSQNNIRDIAYVGGGTVAEAYLRTLMMDRGGMGHRLGSEINGVLSFKSEIIDGDTSDEDDGPGLLAKMFATSLKVVIEQGTSRRRLMISKKGYIGLVPPGAQEDDHICVLFGCTVPVIIRKVYDYHTFIGESYVHSIMDGEAISQMNDGALTEEEFILR